MKNFVRYSLVFLAVVFFASNVWADAPKKILQLKDLESGTKAIGFSVFKGAEPQSFDVILGNTIDQAGNSLILARIYGGPMDTPLEKIGAISGMSGSPIFIDCNDLEDCTKNGTLVGALSYSVGYFLEGGPNVLLTPAEYMLGARFGGYIAGSNFSSRPPNKININGKEFTNLMLFPKMENIPIASNSDGRCKDALKSDIKPGSMVSVFLATGAMNIGGSGTVTWRDGDNIYIFGHPMMGSGMVNYPFIQVAVADTLQTPFNASKLTGCSLDTKGAMFVDGAFEMAGVIGATASMLPYQVEVHLGNSVVILSEEIASSPSASAIIQKIPVIWAQQLFGDLSYYSLVYQARITLKDQSEIFIRNMVPVQVYDNPFEEVFSRIYASLEALGESRFDYRPESIEVHLDIIKDFGLWTAKKSFLSQDKAVPGETVYVNVILEEYFSSTTKQISIPVKVPDDFMDRMGTGIMPNITIMVQSGNKFDNKQQRAEIISVEDLIKQMNEAGNYKTNVLYVQQIMPKNKSEQEADKTNAKAAVKSAWKWADVGEGDLKQLPSNNKNDVVLTLSPTLNNFIDLNLTFNLQVQAKDVTTEKNSQKTKNRKWFWIF